MIWSVLLYPIYPPVLQKVHILHQVEQVHAYFFKFNRAIPHWGSTRHSLWLAVDPGKLYCWPAVRKTMCWQWFFWSVSWWQILKYIEIAHGNTKQDHNKVLRKTSRQHVPRPKNHSSLSHDVSGTFFNYSFITWRWVGRRLQSHRYFVFVVSWWIACHDKTFTVLYIYT